MTGILKRRCTITQTDKCHVKMNAEIGPMSTSQVRQTSKPLESRRGTSNDPLREPSGESGKALIL